jgi:hypothetical protein
MKLCHSSVATLRSRLRATHAVLEELVIVKVAANGIRERTVLKAISTLKENALLGDEKIVLSPGLMRLHTDELSPEDIENDYSPFSISKLPVMVNVRRQVSNRVIKRAA